MHTYTYTYTHTGIHTYLHTCIKHIYIYIYIYIYIRTKGVPRTGGPFLGTPIRRLVRLILEGAKGVPRTGGPFLGTPLSSSQTHRTRAPSRPVCRLSLQGGAPRAIDAPYPVSCPVAHPAPCHPAGCDKIHGHALKLTSRELRSFGLNFLGSCLYVGDFAPWK